MSASVIGLDSFPCLTLWCTDGSIQQSIQNSASGGIINDGSSDNDSNTGNVETNSQRARQLIKEFFGRRKMLMISRLI
jgi:hypothetical protein